MIPPFIMTNPLPGINLFRTPKHLCRPTSARGTNILQGGIEDAVARERIRLGVPLVDPQRPLLAQQVDHLWSELSTLESQVQTLESGGGDTATAEDDDTTSAQTES